MYKINKIILKSKIFLFISKAFSVKIKCDIVFMYILKNERMDIFL
jgi:hypothetical protein